MVQTRFGCGERGFSQTQNVLVKLILGTSGLPKVGFNFVTRMKNLRQFATSTPSRRTPFRSPRFGTFPIFPVFSRFVRRWFGDYPDWSFSFFLAFFNSTYEEQSRKGPRHNPDRSRKKSGKPPGLGFKPPGLASPNSLHDH